jgi:integrase
VTGIRLAESIALRLDSITGATGARRLQVTGKGKKERMIPLQPGLEGVLERYLHSRAERHGPDALKDPAAALLVHYDGSALTRGRVQYVIQQLYRRAGLTAAVPAGALVHACVIASRRWRSSTARTSPSCASFWVTHRWRRPAATWTPTQAACVTPSPRTPHNAPWTSTANPPPPSDSPGERRGPGYERRWLVDSDA